MKKMKLQLKLFIRYSRDILKGNISRFAKKDLQKTNFDFKIEIRQEIKPSETFENKVFNLGLAGYKVSDVVIFPNQLFSFWNSVGNPEIGFKKGRTIQNGVIKEDNAGGICQVSGLVYYLSLLAGMDVVERYNHSVDIYNEETRFAPLGADATVVYGYKDLRFINNHSSPIKFQITIDENYIIGRLLSKSELVERNIRFEEIHNDNSIEVLTYDNNKPICTSFYKKLIL